MAGGAAGGVAAALTTPLDVVKTRLQLEGVGSPARHLSANAVGLKCGNRVCFRVRQRSQNPLSPEEWGSPLRHCSAVRSGVFFQGTPKSQKLCDPEGVGQPSAPPVRQCGGSDQGAGCVVQGFGKISRITIELPEEVRQPPRATCPPTRRGFVRG